MKGAQNSRAEYAASQTRSPSALVHIALKKNKRGRRASQCGQIERRNNRKCYGLHRNDNDSIVSTLKEKLSPTGGHLADCCQSGLQGFCALPHSRREYVPDSAQSSPMDCWAFGSDCSVTTAPRLNSDINRRHLSCATRVNKRFPVRLKADPFNFSTVKAKFALPRTKRTIVGPEGRENSEKEGWNERAK